MTAEYLPLEALLSYCRQADERGGMVSTTEIRLWATLHRVTAESVAFAAWAESMPTANDLEAREVFEPTPDITDLQALENRR